MQTRFLIIHQHNLVVLCLLYMLPKEFWVCLVLCHTVCGFWYHWTWMHENCQLNLLRWTKNVFEFNWMPISELDRISPGWLREHVGARYWHANTYCRPDCDCTGWLRQTQIVSLCGYLCQCQKASSLSGYWVTLYCWQLAFWISFTWASHIAASMLMWG